MAFIQNKRGLPLHIHECITNPTASNVIFCCTPVISTVELQACYLPLHEMGFNVFALDFAGTGKSGGAPADFTTTGVIDDFDSLITHIKTKSTGNIYLFADGGIGGIIGQYYVSGKTPIQGFAQFAVALYRKTSSLGVPTPLAVLCLPIVKFLCKIAPNMRLPMNPPKYTGYHAEEDDAFYNTQLEKSKDFFRANIHFVRVLLEILVGKNSRLKQTPAIPTLLFKTMHDRYFPTHYFDDYFAQLQCPKKLHVVEDVHNSYALYPQEFATAVAEWFLTLDSSH